MAFKIKIGDGKNTYENLPSLNLPKSNEGLSPDDMTNIMLKADYVDVDDKITREHLQKMSIMPFVKNSSNNKYYEKYDRVIMDTYYIVDAYFHASFECESCHNETIDREDWGTLSRFTKSEYESALANPQSFYENVLKIRFADETWAGYYECSDYFWESQYFDYTIDDIIVSSLADDTNWREQHDYENQYINEITLQRDTLYYDTSAKILYQYNGTKLIPVLSGYMNSLIVRDAFNRDLNYADLLNSNAKSTNYIKLPYGELISAFFTNDKFVIMPTFEQTHEYISNNLTYPSNEYGGININFGTSDRWGYKRDIELRATYGLQTLKQLCDVENVITHYDSFNADDYSTDDYNWPDVAEQFENIGAYISRVNKIADDTYNVRFEILYGTSVYCDDMMSYESWYDYVCLSGYVELALTKQQLNNWINDSYWFYYDDYQTSIPVNYIVRDIVEEKIYGSFDGTLIEMASNNNASSNNGGNTSSNEGITDISITGSGNVIANAMLSSDGKTLNMTKTSVLSTSGGSLNGDVTMAGALTFDGEDEYGIFTDVDNYCSIGDTEHYFYRSYINNMYTSNINTKSGQPLYLKTAGSTRMTITTAGNVGIGTTAPVSKLHIIGTTETSLATQGLLTLGSTTVENLSFDQNGIQARNNGAANTLYINEDGGDVSFGGGIVRIGNSSTTATLNVKGNAIVSANDVADGYFEAQNYKGKIALLAASNRGVYDSTKDSWLIATDGTNTWMPQGNVGIGTTSPAYKLQVNGTAVATAFSMFRADGQLAHHMQVNDDYTTFLNASGNKGFDFRGIRAGSSTYSTYARIDANGAMIYETSGSGRQTLLTGSDIMSYAPKTGGWAEGYLAYDGYGASMGAIAGAHGTGGTLNYMYYGGTWQNPHIVIKPNGRVGILQKDPQYNLDVTGTMRATTAIYSEHVYQTSDDTLKTYIEDYHIDLQDVLKIPTKKFIYNDDESQRVNIGTSAQTMQTICHEIVDDTQDVLSIDYSKMSIIAINAIQQLIKQNETLTREINELKKMIAEK